MDIQKQKNGEWTEATPISAQDVGAWPWWYRIVFRIRALFNNHY